MTIKRYLFLLLTTIIVLMAASQLFLVDQLKQKIEQEIDIRSKRFATHIIDMTLENIPENEDVDIELLGDNSEPKINNNEKVKRDKARNYSSYNIKVSDRTTGYRKSYEIVLGKISPKTTALIADILSNETVARRNLIIDLLKQLKHKRLKSISDETANTKIVIEKDNRIPHHQFKKRLKQQIDQFKFSQANNHTDKNAALPPAVVKVIENRQSKSDKKQTFLLAKLTQSITYIIIFTSIFGIVLVFWLSNKISQPIFDLTQGFRRVQQGEKGAQVAVSGTNEIQFAIKQFNTMSDQLVQLEQMETKLNERSHLEEIGDVSKGIAHALRNPLHTIGLAIDQMQKPNCDKTEQAALLANIKVKITQLDKSISALLTLTSGQIDRNSNIEINSLIKDIALELKQSHMTESAKLNIVFDIGPQSFVIGELNELRSIIHTIIFNAYEAALSANQDIIELHITKLQNDEQTCITVVDNGGGIDPNIEPTLFAPHISSKPEGAGMGLYIGKRITELYYNGSLDLKNHQDGAKATLILRNQ